MTENQEEKLFEFTFVVFVDEFSLKNLSLKELKFTCEDLFAHKQLEYSWLKSDFSLQRKAIPGQAKYMISRMKKSEMKKYLDQNYLHIHEFDDDIKIGTSLVDLSPFFKNQVEEMPFGSKHEDKVKMFDKPTENSGSAIGSIKIEVILETEECYTCKSCKPGYYKVSNMQKHFARPKNDCKEAYNEAELQTFKDDSEKRRKQMKAQRKRITYDPAKKSEENKRYYSNAK